MHTPQYFTNHSPFSNAYGHQRRTCEGWGNVSGRERKDIYTPYIDGWVLCGRTSDKNRPGKVNVSGDGGYMELSTHHKCYTPSIHVVSHCTRHDCNISDVGGWLCEDVAAIWRWRQSRDRILCVMCVEVLVLGQLLLLYEKQCASRVSHRAVKILFHWQQWITRIGRNSQPWVIVKDAVSFYVSAGCRETLPDF